MTTFGGNDFFETIQGAKSAATRRQMCDGATIRDTEKGYCLLGLGEGCTDKSYKTVSQGTDVLWLRDGKWSDY